MSYPVILPSLGRVSSRRSRIGKPFFSTGDTYTYWPRAFPTHTGIGPCNSSNTEEQGARVGPNMRLQTMCFSSRSPLFFIPRTLAALDLSSFMYFLPLITVRGYDWITYILKRTGYQLPLSCPGFMDITRIFSSRRTQFLKPLRQAPQDHSRIQKLARSYQDTSFYEVLCLISRYIEKVGPACYGLRGMARSLTGCLAIRHLRPDVRM